MAEKKSFFTESGSLAKTILHAEATARRAELGEKKGRRRRVRKRATRVDLAKGNDG